MLSPTISLWLLPVASLISLIGAWCASRGPFTPAREHTLTGVTLPLVAAIPGVWLALVCDPFLFPGSAVPAYPLTPWILIGLPLLAATAALGTLFIGAPRLSRPRPADVARWMAAAAVALYAAAAGRVGLLEAQLMMLGVFLLWWLEGNAAAHRPATPAEHGTTTKPIFGGGFVAFLGALALGWLAARAIGDPRWTPLVLSSLLAHALFIAMIPGAAAPRDAAPLGVRRAITTATSIAAVSLGVGLALVTLSRVLADAWRSIELARSAGDPNWLAAAAEALGARPYLSGLGIALGECAAAVVAAVVLWSVAMLPADTAPLPRRLRLFLGGLVILAGAAMLGIAVWRFVGRLHDLANFL